MGYFIVRSGKRHLFPPPSRSSPIGGSSKNAPPSSRSAPSDWSAVTPVTGVLSSSFQALCRAFPSEWKAGMRVLIMAWTQRGAAALYSPSGTSQKPASVEKRILLELWEHFNGFYYVTSLKVNLRWELQTVKLPAACRWKRFVMSLLCVRGRSLLSTSTLKEFRGKWSSLSRITWNLSVCIKHKKCYNPINLLFV